MRSRAERGRRIQRSGWVRIGPSWSSLAMSCCLGLAAGATEAEEENTGAPGACFRWSSPEGSTTAAGCPTEAQISGAVRALVGHQVFRGRDCSLVVEGHFERRPAGAGWSAVVRLDRQDKKVTGTRRLESSDLRCGALQGPTALAIALMVESEEQEEVAMALPDAPPPTAASRSVATAVPDSSGWQVRGSLGARGESGLLPGSALGLRFGISFLSPSFWSVELHGSALFPRTAEVNGRGGAFWAWRAGLSWCPDFNRNRRGRVGICAGLLGGAVTGQGQGLDYEFSSARPWLGSELRGVGALQVMRTLAVYGEFGASLGLARARFVYLDSLGAPRDVFRLAPWTFFGGLGLEWGARAGDRHAPPPSEANEPEAWSP